METCAACPNQWDAWTADGQYLYLRYRSGIGTVDAYDAPGPDGWTVPPDGRVARFEEDEPSAIDIELDDFLRRTGLRLAPDAVVSSKDDQPVQCWHAEPDTPCDWDVCRQPERLAAGDRGVDPALRREQP